MNRSLIALESQGRTRHTAQFMEGPPHVLLVLTEERVGARCVGPERLPGFVGRQDWCDSQLCHPQPA